MAADAEALAVGVPELQPVHHELHQAPHVIRLDDLLAPLEEVPFGLQLVRLGSAWLDDRDLAAMPPFQKFANLDQEVDGSRDVVRLTLCFVAASLGQECLQGFSWELLTWVRWAGGRHAGAPGAAVQSVWR
jgi:hypothetical protein